MRVARNIIYQDNKSAVLLEDNGKKSSGKRTRHLDIRYFLVTDAIARKDCETKWIWYVRGLYDEGPGRCQVSSDERFRHGRESCLSSMGDRTIFSMVASRCLARYLPHGYCNTVSKQGVCWILLQIRVANRCFYQLMS